MTELKSGVYTPTGEYEQIGLRMGECIAWVTVPVYTKVEYIHVHTQGWRQL